MIQASKIRLDQTLRASFPTVNSCVHATDPNHAGWSDTHTTWRALGSEMVRIDWPSQPSAGDITSVNAIVDAFDPSQAAQDAADNLAARTLAISALSDPVKEFKLLRATMLAILDELNLHATKINAILTAIDAGANLAAVKTNIAAIADYPQRTAAQVRTTITNKITAGDADS